MAEKNYIIETEDLTKCYGEKTAVDHLNLSIEKGEIFGLLGPNGAGKTTTTLMLTGLTEPTSGKALIGGCDCTKNPMEVKRIVGYMPDNVGFYGDLTGRENLQFTAALNGIEPEAADGLIDELLERVGMTYAADQKARTYSKGMRQRLGIADVLIKDPSVIIMDEPTLGIDPEGMRDLMRLIEELARDDGRTILISSHQLYQIQQVCDRVGIFVAGRLIASGRIEDLGRQVETDEYYLLEVAAEPADEGFVRMIRELPGVQSIGKEKSIYLIGSVSDIRKELVETAVSRGYTILHLRPREDDLDEIYRRYFEKAGQNDGDNSRKKVKRFISRNR